MRGQLFVHFAEDNQVPGRINIRTGIVKRELGAEHFYLEFQGAKLKFGNVFSAAQLTGFAFFSTEVEQKAFIDELLAQQQANALPPAEAPTPAEAP